MRFLLVCLAVAWSAPSSGESLKILALDSAPFLFNTEGAPAGIEYDILSYFAKSRELDLDVEFVTGFPELLERILRGDGDIAAGTITITEAREAEMDFSAPYFPVRIVLVERKGEASASIEDLAGSEVAAFARTTASEALEAVSNVRVVQRDGVDGMLDAVANGEVQAMAADSSAVIPLLDGYPTLQITLSFGDEQHFGFALPKGSPLKAPLSEHIQLLRESGIYFRVITEHMGPEATEIVRAAKR